MMVGPGGHVRQQTSAGVLSRRAWSVSSACSVSVSRSGLDLPVMSIIVWRCSATSADAARLSSISCCSWSFSGREHGRVRCGRTPAGRPPPMRRHRLRWLPSAPAGTRPRRRPSWPPAALNRTPRASGPSWGVGVDRRCQDLRRARCARRPRAPPRRRPPRPARRRGCSRPDAAGACGGPAWAPARCWPGAGGPGSYPHAWHHSQSELMGMPQRAQGTLSVVSAIAARTVTRPARAGDPRGPPTGRT